MGKDSEALDGEERLYERFSDGWDFSPDAGNQYSRAEVFTPKHAVDEMLISLGLFAREAVEGGDYTTLSDDEAEHAVKASVIEPAVGTANFLSEVLWHKLNYAYELTGRDSSLSYDVLATEALGSVYANDIDCGNLQTAKHRLLFGGDVKVDEEAAFWVKQCQEQNDIFPEEGEAEIKASLLKAQNKWGVFLKNDGVLLQLYRKHTGAEPSDYLKEMWEEIVDRNLLLFDSLTEENSGVIPGWTNILWHINTVSLKNGEVSVKVQPVSYRLQIQVENLQQLQAEAALLPEGRKRTNLMNRISSLKESLSELPGAELPGMAEILSHR